MKFSKFYNRISLSPHTDVLFNSLSEESRIIPASLDLELNTLSNDIITDFQEAGIIICQDIVEEDIVRNSFSQNCQKQQFKLTINPTLNCNFRCWYCYESHKASSDMTDITLEKVKKTIDYISQRYDSIDLAFFGGEPFLKFDSIVKPLIEYTAKLFSQEHQSYLITFTTNGFLIKDDHIDFLSKFNTGVTQITLDGGPKFHNATRISRTKNSFDTIVGNIQRMASSQLPVLLRINVTKDNIQSAFEIPRYFEGFSDLEKSKIHVLIQQVWQDVDNDILDDIWILYGEFIKVGLSTWPRRFNFYKNICYADTCDSAVINSNGKIFKCTAIDFDKSKSDGEIADDGSLNISEAYIERMNKRLSNKLCPNCRIYPVCNGGCSKNIDQAQTKDYCLHPTEAAKDKVIRNIFREQLHMSNLGISWKD